MPSFYNNLFGVEITVLGIITAAIFVLIQSLHSNFSYHHILSLIKRPLLVLYSTVAVATVLITSISSLLLSLDRHNFISKYDLEIDRYLVQEYVALCILFLFFFSILIRLIVLFKGIGLLNPSNLLLISRREINSKLLRLYLFKKYGIKKPSAFDFQHNINIDVRSLTLNESHIIDSTTLNQEGREKIEEQKIQDKNKLEKANAKYSKLKTSVEQTLDIFEGLLIILDKAIATRDTNTVRKSIEILTEVSNDFIKTFPQSKELPTRLGWEPDSQLAAYYARYIGELLVTLLENCQRHNTLSLSLYFIRATKDIALSKDSSIN